MSSFAITGQTEGLETVSLANTRKAGKVGMGGRVGSIINKSDMVLSNKTGLRLEPVEQEGLQTELHLNSRMRLAGKEFTQGQKQGGELA